jgi:hypothetical protein
MMNKGFHQGTDRERAGTKKRTYAFMKWIGVILFTVVGTLTVNAISPELSLAESFLSFYAITMFTIAVGVTLLVAYFVFHRKQL